MFLTERVMRSALLSGLCVLFLPWASGQESMPAPFIVEFDDAGATPVLDEAQASALADLNLSNDQLIRLAAAARSYQVDKEESLGVTLNLDNVRASQLELSSSLTEDQIAISQAYIEAFNRGDVGTSASGDFEDRLSALQEELDNNLNGFGAFSAAAIEYRRGAGQDQTVDPIDTGLDQAEKDKLIAFCNKYPDQCEGIQGISDTIAGIGTPMGGSTGARVFGLNPPAPDEVEDLIPPALKRFIVNPAALFGWAASMDPPGNEVKACSESRSRFRSTVENNKNAFQSGGDKWKTIASALENALDFDTACLEGPTGMPPQIEQRIAVLKERGKEMPFCTAYQISDSEFLTAMHCFHDKDSGLPKRSRLKDTLVYLYSSPSTAIEIEPIPAISITRTNKKEEIASKSDYYVLTAADPIPGLQDVTYADAKIGEEAFVPGYFHFVDTSGSQRGHGTWKEHVRWTKSIGGNYCRIVDVSEEDDQGCLVHHCQAIPGFSGSPVLQLQSNGDYALVGVHAGADRARSRNCPTPFLLGGDTPFIEHGNFASIITKARIGQ